MSLSAADTRWTDLLRMLARLNNDIEYSEEEIENLSWQEKTKLVQKDPVTCSRYFDHRVQEFLNTVLKSSCEPIGKVKDFFYSVEFQQRGSPHIHMLVWIENAPNLERSSREEIEQFVDNYLTCSTDNKKLSIWLSYKHINTQELAERRENQYVDLDFQYLPFQEPCYYIHLMRKLKSTKQNTHCFRK